MKKLFLGSLLAVCALLMTSCLDGGKNERSGVAFGMIGYAEKNFKPVLYTGGDLLYAPEIDKNVSTGMININDCALISFYLDMEIPENSPQAIAANGYTTISATNYLDVPRYSLSASLQDTAVVDTTEMLVSFIDEAYTALFPIKQDAKLFLLGTVHDNVLEDQEQKFTLSYNPDQELELINGEKVYNLYLRVVKTKDGKKSLSSSRQILNAFDLTQFLNSVKYKGEEKVSFRVNCVKKLNEDKTKIEDWLSSKVMTYVFPKDE